MKLRLLLYSVMIDDGIYYGFRDFGWDVKSVSVFDDFPTIIRKNGHKYDAVFAAPFRVLDNVLETKYALGWLGLPYLIENASGVGLAPLGKGTVMFCGSMFGGPAEHTLFESNIGITPPALTCQHDKEPWHNDNRYHFGKYLARELATFFVTPY